MGMTYSKIFDLSFLVDQYDSFIKKSVKNSGYTCFCNSHMIYESRMDKTYSEVLKNAKFLVPDGVPLLYSIRLLSDRRAKRMAGNDVTFSLVDLAQKEKLKMFWIGGQESVLDLISHKLKTKGVDHQIYSPPFLPIEDFDFERQAQMINDFNPDIIMVGLGCPKQEIWMYKMMNIVKAPMYGVGGAFLLFAGLDSRAPKWMRDLSLEWLYRLFLEPKRLFKRYLITNTYFCYLFGKEVIKKLVGRK